MSRAWPHRAADVSLHFFCKPGARASVPLQYPALNGIKHIALEISPDEPSLTLYFIIHVSLVRYAFSQGTEPIDFTQSLK